MRSDLLARLATHPGLCATCEHLNLLASPRSVFVRCGLAAADGVFPRYPPLPVLHCRGYRAATPAPGGAPGDPDGAAGAADGS